MQKAGKVFTVLAMYAFLLFLGAGNIFTSLLFGGITAVLSLIAYVLNRI